MKVAINCKKFDTDHIEFINNLIDTLSSKKIDFIINHDLENIEKSNYTTFNYKTNFDDIDYFFSVGGDGTLLNTATYIGNKKIPILGINTGRLGFWLQLKLPNLI